jgi:hypothetical protein
MTVLDQASLTTLTLGLQQSAGCDADHTENVRSRKGYAVALRGERVLSLNNAFVKAQLGSKSPILMLGRTGR